MAQTVPWKRYRFKKSTLKNGVRVVSESNPNAVSVALGIYINRGTRDEMPSEAGMAHFVEHMLFKGTSTRNAFDISKHMEEIGSDINAFTSKESTTYVATTLPEHLNRSVEVLCDLVTNPLFLAKDIEPEREVVIQEIRSAQDQLEDCVFDVHFGQAYRGHKLGLPILGTVESVGTMSRERVLGFYRRQYVAQNMVVAASGQVDHRELCDMVSEWLKPQSGIGVRTELPAGLDNSQATVCAFQQVKKRKAEQVHIVVGAPSPGFRERRRFEAIALNMILGGGLTSRLYQEVRERRGLAYSVYSQLQSFVDSGTMLMYAACQPRRAPEAIEAILREIVRLRKKGVTAEELAIAKTQMRAATVIHSDDPESRMQSIAVNEAVFGRYRPIGEVLEEYERIELDAVNELAREVLSLKQVGMTVMGPLPIAAFREFLDKEINRLERPDRKRALNQRSRRQRGDW